MKVKANSVILLLILSLIWGTSFILIKKGLVAYSPGQVGSLRIMISGLIFLPYLIINYKKINFKVFKYIVAFAFLEIGAPPYLYSFAQTVVNSGTAGILNSLVPLFTLLTGFILFRIRTNFFKVCYLLCYKVLACY